VTFAAEYSPTGTPGPAPSGSIDEFLAERYCMYAAKRNGRLLRGDISHGPWMIQPVETTISANSVLSAAGLTAIADPLTAYSPGTHAVAWPMSSERSSSALGRVVTRR
jgi:uncharacterized protein